MWPHATTPRSETTSVRLGAIWLRIIDVSWARRCY
jgi:hypothetical protein